MSQVSNPYETNTENNLVVTSYIDQSQKLLIIRMAPNTTMIQGNYNTAFSLINEDYYEIKICGELIQNNTGFNIMAIFNAASVYDNWNIIAVDKATYEVFTTRNHNIVIQDNNNIYNFINLKSCEINKYNSYYYYRSPFTKNSETIDSNENAFDHYNKFYNDYNDKISSFKIICPDLINQDKYFSTTYETGDIFNLDGTLQDTDAFYVDTSYTEKYPNTYSKEINNNLIVLIDSNTNFNTIQLQLDAFNMMNAPLDKYSGTMYINCYQNENLENPHAMVCTTISTDYENGIIKFIFNENFNRYIDISTFLNETPNTLNQLLNYEMNLVIYTLGLSSASITLINQ